MSELTDEIVADLKHQHGDVYKIEALGKVIVIKTPDDKIFQRFRDYGADDERRSVATKKLVQDTVVWPPKPEFDAMVKAQPGLSESWGSEVARIAGLTRVVESTKL